MSMRPSAALKLAFFIPLVALAQPASKEVPATLAPLVDTVKQAVVNVDVQSRSKVPPNVDPELYERFLKERGLPQKEQIRSGTGSGFIIDPKGLIVTNHHVIENAVTIRVRLDDARAFDAEVVGTDPLTDVALLKLKGTVPVLPTIRLGDSRAMKVGDWALAIGNPFGLASSVSLGIISALDRAGGGMYDEYLQTDAAINPGNSGGPLINMKGEVIGINTRIAGIGTGIGFAVPSNVVKSLLPQLEKSGRVVRGYLGVDLQDLTPPVAKALGVPQSEGAIILSVAEGSPAAKGGIKVDDVVVGLDGEKVLSESGLRKMVAMKKPESTVAVAVFREGKRQEQKVLLAARPESPEGAMSPSAPQSKQPLGLSYQAVDPRAARQLGITGVQVTDVVPGSPADLAGLDENMLILEANKKPVRTIDELTAVLKGARSGGVVLLRALAPNEGRTHLYGLEVP
jgi:serine protease Do